MHFKMNKILPKWVEFGKKYHLQCFMLIGTLALTGFPFLSGFYSKDAIIEFAYLKNSLGWILCKLCRSFYSFINSNLFLEIIF